MVKWSRVNHSTIRPLDHFCVPGDLMVGATKRAFSFISDVWHEFTEDRGLLFAAAISFYGLISLIPLLLVAIAVLGYITGSSETARQEVITLARNLIPVGTEDLGQNLKALSEQSGLLGGLGLLGLLWIGSQVFVTLQQVMNIALGSQRHISFLRGRLVALAMVVVTGILIAISIGVTSVLTALSHFHPPWGYAFDSDAILGLLGTVVTIFTSTLAFVLAYKFLPTKSIGTMGPVWGGVTAGLLFEAAKYAFSWYVTNVVNYSRIYGSIGGAVILVLWIYYVSVIAVLGAEIASVHARRVGAVNGQDG